MKRKSCRILHIQMAVRRYDVSEIKILFRNDQSLVKLRKKNKLLSQNINVKQLTVGHGVYNCSWLNILVSFTLWLVSTSIK